MKKVAFLHISAKDFCGLENFEADFSDKTVIKGKNREGKTTVRNIIYWILTDKLSDNSSAGDSIRPHDENGVRKDFVDVTASLTVGVDDEQFTLTKTQKQRWVKRRGSEDREFQGNENLYEINGVPKSAKDFSTFISENICNIEDLAFCINANTFLSLDNKKRRAKLLSLANEFSDEDVIATNPEFEELRSDLKVGTVEEISKRDKANITALKKNQAELPARIDEVSKSIIHEDFAELELQKNTLKEKLIECEAKASEEITLQTTISKMKGELAALVGKLTATVKDKKHELEMKLADVNSERRAISANINAYESEIEYLEQAIENRQKVIAETEVNLDNAKNREIDQISLICPTCGQLMPMDKQDENKAKLEAQKHAEMDRYYDYLDTLKAELKTSVEKVKAIKEKLPEMKENKEQLSAQVAQLEKDISAASETVNYEDDPEYIAKQKEIENLENQLPAFRDYKTDKYVVKEQLEEIEYRLGKAAANEKAEERIEQLKKEQLVVAQNIAKVERHLDLLDKFNRARIGLLEDSVNAYFDVIKWRFFEKQINGGYQEVCKAEVNGTSYDGLLNKSDRILCQMDLCKGFMRSVWISLPLIGDDMESVDPERIPEYDGQMILFRRESCPLTVEKG